MRLMVAVALFQAGLGAGLVLFGRWGRRSAEMLVPSHLDPVDREARVNVYRRGSIACIVAGAMLVLLSGIALAYS